jgi:hypothetical protein
MNAVGAVGRCLVFATPDAHVTGGTAQPPRRLRLERLVDSGLPPGIRPCGPAWGERRRDRCLHFRGLCWGQLDVHESQIIVLANRSPVRGISLNYPAFTRSGDAHASLGDGDSHLMRHLIERIPPMLQWNSKFAVVVLVAVALAAMIAAAHGWSDNGGANFTW